ncbi:hypothetical protein [Isoptericola dokdonensis]|uniref:BZIP domain-containing protein n=1 Tax=Isoptericola dokdonensis DS-3 TaxID=1300344 RepID=A0A161I208_9MICO|nr:hypothetical protein [Isoptericola dokdonensis]ANC31445.1 hypothetical protein I598_1897 [Isoptericola dokdonensis DS-3]
MTAAAITLGVALVLTLALDVLLPRRPYGYRPRATSNPRRPRRVPRNPASATRARRR